MRFPRRLLSLAAALTAASSIASGYYHFVYFAGRSAPFNPINLQFDLSKTANNTVYYFISDSGPNVFVKGDSFTAVISELQLAAQAWTLPGVSQLKLGYGGMENAQTQQSAPGIDVVFDDSNIAVGILAQTKVTTYANVGFIANNPTSSLSILRSVIQFRKDLTVTSPQQASFYDSSFTTMVHEFGHAIGLQHTLTSATMSTYTTRSTTKAMPLAPDDLAGVSLLYPAPGYLATTGSISGQVTLNGNGVNLASVVALSPTTGAAISSLTNPDGTYRIDAVPPGNYLLYVHPLPPAARGEAGPDAIVLPFDSSQSPFFANTSFVTQFFGGTRDWTQTPQISVNAQGTANANFEVLASGGPAIYAMELAGFVNNATEWNPMLPANNSYSMEFYAPGTTAAAATQLAPGLNVSVIGNQAPASVVPGYTKIYQQGYVSMGIYTNQVQSTTPVALAVTVNNDLYVLPAAFYVTPSGPPVISGLNQNTDSSGNGTLTVFGSGLSSATRILFDGTVANLLSTNGDGSLTVQAPPAPASYNSSIEALNPDGQTSGQAIPLSAPQQYFYNYVNPAAIQQISPSSAAAGTDAVIQISGNSTNFNSQTQVGFGSSDIVVKQIFLVNPGLLQVNISVNAQAPSTFTSVTVTTGLQSATQTLYFQITAPVQNQVTMRAPVLNASTGSVGTPAGATANIAVSGMPANTPSNLAGWTLIIGQQIAQGTFFNNGDGTGVISAIVPGGLGTGAQVVQLTSPTGVAIPQILMQIDSPPPVILSVLNSSGAPISASQPAHPGDMLTINLIGLFDGNSAQSTATVSVAQSQIPVLQVNNPNILVQLPFNISTGTMPLTVAAGTRVSAPFFLNIHN